MKTRIVVSFVGKGQLPYVMVTKEYYNIDGSIDFAEIIYQEEYQESDVAITGDVLMAKDGNDLKLYPCYPRGGFLI